MVRFNRTKEYREWSKAVRDRDGCCQVCKTKTKQLHAHHVIPKNIKKWRLDITNGITLCPGCHVFGTLSAHKNPIWFSNWLLTNHPIVLYKALFRIKEFENEKNG